MTEHFLRMGLFFQLMVGAFALALGVYLTALLRRSRAIMNVATVLFAVGTLLTTAVIVQRYFEADRAPFKTLYESLVLFIWCTGVIFLAVQQRYPLALLGVLMSGVQVATAVYAVMRADVEVVNLPAALQSAWFVPHVVIYLGGYSALLCAGVAATIFLAKPQLAVTFRRRGGDELLNYGQIMHRLNIFGFLFITLGLVTGSLWAKTAWGDYWTWDPKENWSLVTWLFYLIYFHLHLLPRWTTRRAAAICLIGVGAVFFTYLGVALLPTAEQSVHVYQQ